MVRLESGTDGIKCRMPFLPSANIASVLYWPQVPSKFLAAEYPMLKSGVRVNFLRSFNINLLKHHLDLL
jgi:hypothetical protein